jgi:hypothetical protein
MTHDELLDKIEDIEYWQEQYAGKTFMKAIRAVVELHKPIKDEWIEYTTCKACRVDMDDHYSPEYPCPTIQAITRNINS